ncbi:hypothetical protein FCM35_KLT05718 [Carex littledalei]|uniref:Uncharacterized protein n=1 Tax=Carex littledalei TaxID=544730 RepID=A0A833QL75_9POAL|nr:hypothetical protein FCM35_KLT05718 [Carex littledalei]
MSSRRGSRGFSLRQPAIVDIGCNCRRPRILFSLFSSHPKPKSTTSYSPSSSTTLTTTTSTTAATTTTTDTWDPPSFTTNFLNEGRPNHSSTKTDQTSYSPSSSTTHNYYGRNHYHY